ncbi:PIN domain-containing protein [Candidatus Bipolaricaulota bacterium]|nr:PIN domain-containing protein [Candidatus Bipolaricaulota bacterium]
MSKIFVDTSAFYALADESDHNHARAKDAYESLIKERLVTTDYVLLECWFLIGRHLGRLKAIKFWDAMRSGIVDMINGNSQGLDQARAIIDRFPDQDFSLVDASSFATMEREGIKTAFTFDAHFRVYRFGKDKRRYFDVVPQ